MKKSDWFRDERPAGGWNRTPLLVMLAGVLITTSLFWWAQTSTQQRFRTEFDGDATIRANLLTSALDDRMADLNSVRRFYAGSASVEPWEFKAFVAPIPEVRAGVEMIAWVPKVAQTERVRVVAEARKNGLTDFQITERDPQGRIVPAKARETTYPICFLERLAGNEPAVGLDLGTEPACLDAMTRAGNTGQAVATESLPFPADKQGRVGVFVFVPVYRNDALVETLAQRRAALQGFVAGMFRVGDVAAAALNNTPKMGLPTDFIDCSAPAEKRLLYRWEPRLRSKRTGMASDAGGEPPLRQLFKFGGREWRLEVFAGPAYRHARRSHAYWLILPVGLFMTGLLGFYLRTLVSHRERAEKLVQERTASLLEREAALEAITSSAQDAMLLMDPRGTISFWNPAAERILGWTQAEAVGKKIQDLVAPPPCPEATQKVFRDLEAIGLGQAVGETLELSLVRKDKTPIVAELALSSVVLDGTWHAVAVLRDITERKRAEAQLAKAEKQYHDLVNNLAVGVYRNTPGETGRFLEANPAMANMFEAESKEEFMRHSVSELYVNGEERRKFSEKITRQGSVKDEEVEVKTLKGRRFWASVTATMRRDETGQVFFDGIIEDITERKQAEDSLQRERILMRTVIDNLPDVIYAKDTACRKTLANRADLRIMGRKSEAEVLGKTDFEFYAKDAAIGFFDDDQSVIQSGNPVLNREEFFRDIHGEERWLMTSKLPLRDESGQIIGLVGIGHDITERKRFEETIQRERILLRTLIDHLPDAIYVKDAACRKTVANRADVENIGRASEAEVVGKNDLELFPNEIGQRGYADDQAVVQTGQPVLNREEDFFDAQGVQRWLLTSKLPLRDERGLIIGLVGIGRDITKRKRVEEAVQRERILLRTLIDNLPDVVYVKDNDGRKTVSNRADYLNTGRASEAEVLGKTDFELFSKDIAERGHVDDQAVLQTGEPVLNREEYFFDAQGAQRWLLTSKLPLRNARGEIIGLVGIGHDITNRKQAEERLRLLSRVVEQSPATIIITDPQGRIDYVNPKFTEISGYSLEEVRGRTPRLLKSGRTPPEEYTRLWRTITSGRVWQGEFCNRRKDGTLFWEAASITAVTDAGGEITHYVAVKEDITAMKRKEEELCQAKEAAEAASRAKSQFLANMSHEIRTPMNGVIGMTGLLLDSDLAPQQREFAETIRSSGEMLMTLLNDLLDFSKIEAGHLDLEMLDFDLREAVEDTAEILALRAQQKGLEFICNIEPKVPALVQGDPGRLRQVLSNLASNAIKFTPRGEVAIHVRLEAETLDTTTVYIEVTDTGIGIPSDKLAALFTPFTQVETSTTRRFGGSGLGLSISKRLVEMMGGSIGVESVEGRGSKFWFQAVFAKPDGEAPPVWKPAAAISGKRGLVVDDNATNRRLVTLLLQAWGCEFEEAASASAALETLHTATRPFDFALLDMHMPGMDGEELGRRIKAEPAFAATPLVMLTSLSERGHTQRLKKIGFAGALTKPVRQAQLYRCLALLLGHPEATPQSQPVSFITASGLPGPRLRKARLLLAEDNITNQKVALGILGKLGYRADAVANGREVIKSLETIPYALVLMDCQMPEMDGYEAARVIRDHGSHVLDHDITIVAMTAYAMQGDREKCLAAGMDDYISKPVQPREIAEVLERWLGAGESDPPPVPPVLPPQPEPGRIVFNAADLMQRLMGDAEMACSISRSFVEEATRRVTDLENALARSDVPTAMRHAHSLKGSSANLGAQALRETTAGIEDLLKSGQVAEAIARLPEINGRFEELKRALDCYLAGEKK